jgi:hypothetical protein
MEVRRLISPRFSGTTRHGAPMEGDIAARYGFTVLSHSTDFSMKLSVLAFSTNVRAFARSSLEGTSAQTL